MKMNEWPPQEPINEAISSREKRRLELARFRNRKPPMSNENPSGLDRHFLNDVNLSLRLLEGLLSNVDADEDPQYLQEDLEVLKKRLLEVQPLTYQEIMARQNYTDVVNEDNVVSVESINSLYKEIYDLAQIGHEWVIEDLVSYRDRLEKIIDCFEEIELITYAGVEEFKEAA